VNSVTALKGFKHLCISKPLVTSQLTDHEV